jgi:mannose-6-phosphate isomerase
MVMGMVKNIEGGDTKPERCNCDASCGENRYHDVGSPGCLYKDNEAYYREYPAMRPKTKVLEIKYTDNDLEWKTTRWGSWRVLAIGDGYKVKSLEILPDQSISLQYHNHREEYWTIVQGTGRVVIRGDIMNVKKGDVFFIPIGDIHKVTCTSLTEPLIAIETQIGEICDEEDIVRV